MGDKFIDQKRGLEFDEKEYDIMIHTVKASNRMVCISLGCKKFKFSRQV